MNKITKTIVYLLYMALGMFVSIFIPPYLVYLLGFFMAVFAGWIWKGFLLDVKEAVTEETPCTTDLLNKRFIGGESVNDMNQLAIAKDFTNPERREYKKSIKLKDRE